MTVFVAIAPCSELSQKQWIFWKNNSLILIPQSKSISSDLNNTYNSRIYFISSNLTVYEIFKYPLPHANDTEQKIGVASSTAFLSESSYIWDRRSNLSRIHLNVMYVIFPPIIFNVNGSDKVSGVYGDLFYALQEKLGFSYSLSYQRENSFGTMNESGSYDGIFGHIQSGEVNWSIADTSVNAERPRSFDFSIPIMKKPRKVVTRQPEEGFDAQAYLIVFNSEFWLTLFVSTLVLIFFMYWTLRLGSVGDRYGTNNLAVAFTFTVLSLFCRENFPLNTNWSGKIICIAVLLWGFLISTSYNAILTSALATSKPYSLINSLEDLLNSPDYTLIFQVAGSTRDHFRKAPENSTGKSENKNYISCFGSDSVSRSEE